MNNRTRATIIGYIGTTISLMNNENAWKAAQELAKKNLRDIDAYVQTLTQEVRDELEPLVKVLKNPRLLTNNDFSANDEQVRTFIFEQIGIHAQETLTSPPAPASDRTIESISAEIQQRQAAMRISQLTGNDRLNSTATPPGGAAHNLAWYNTPDGQAYLYGTSSARETEEFREALYAGIRQAFDARKLIRNILAPHQHRTFQYVSGWLPQNYYVQTGAWWFTATIAFIGNTHNFLNNVTTAGMLSAIVSLLTEGLRSAESENLQQNEVPAVNAGISFWDSPRNDAAPERDNGLDRDGSRPNP